VTLRASTPGALVELLVDGEQIPDDLVYQQDETYERQQNAYCHTWTIKLSNWSSGVRVRLENRARAGSLPAQHNVFLIEVQ
jgi:hypothetical protein